MADLRTLICGVLARFLEKPGVADSLFAKLESRFEDDPLAFLEWAVKMDKALAPAPKSQAGANLPPAGGGRAGVDLTLTEEPAPGDAKRAAKRKARK